METIKVTPVNVTNEIRSMLRLQREYAARRRSESERQQGQTRKTVKPIVSRIHIDSDVVVTINTPIHVYTEQHDTHNRMILESFHDGSLILRKTLFFKKYHDLGETALSIERSIADKNLLNRMQDLLFSLQQVSVEQFKAGETLEDTSGNDNHQAAEFHRLQEEFKDQIQIWKRCRTALSTSKTRVDDAVWSLRQKELMYTVEYSRLYFKMLETNTFEADYFQFKSLLEAPPAFPLRQTVDNSFEQAEPTRNQPMTPGEIVKIFTGPEDQYVLGMILKVVSGVSLLVRNLKSREKMTVNIEKDSSMPALFPKVYYSHAFCGIRQQLQRMQEQVQDDVAEVEAEDFGGQRVELAKSFSGLEFMTGADSQVGGHSHFLTKPAQSELINSQTEEHSIRTIGGTSFHVPPSHSQKVIVLSETNPLHKNLLNRCVQFPIIVDGKRFSSIKHYLIDSMFRQNSYCGAKKQQYEQYASKIAGNERPVHTMQPDKFHLPVPKEWKNRQLQETSKVLVAKLLQYPELADTLLETGDSVLLSKCAEQNSKGNSFMLEKALMRARRMLAPSGEAFLTQNYECWESDKSLALEMAVAKTARSAHDHAQQLEKHGFRTDNLSQKQISEKAGRLSQFFEEKCQLSSKLIEEMMQKYPGMKLCEVPFTSDCLFYALVETLDRKYPTILQKLGLGSKRFIQNVRLDEEMFVGLHKQAMSNLRKRVQNKLQANLPYNIQKLRENQWPIIRQLRAVAAVLNVDVKVLNRHGDHILIRASDSRELLPKGIVQTSDDTETVQADIGFLGKTYFVGLLPRRLLGQTSSCSQYYDKITLAIISLKANAKSVLEVACVINDFNFIETVGQFHKGQIDYGEVPVKIKRKVHNIWKKYCSNSLQPPNNVTVQNFWLDKSTNKVYNQHCEEVGSLSKNRNESDQLYSVQLNLNPSKLAMMVVKDGNQTE